MNSLLVGYSVDVNVELLGGNSPRFGRRISGELLDARVLLKLIGVRRSTAAQQINHGSPQRCRWPGCTCNTSEARTRL